MKFGVAVLGATGYVASPYRREIRELPDEARIISLCARRRDLLEAAGKEDNAELVTDDWRAAISHEDVNLVLVCTPDALHHEAVLECAKRKLHILCEKPVGLNATEAHQMLTAYKAAGLGHFVPFWTRYVEAFRKARDIYSAGELGEVRAFVYRWHNPRPAGMPFTWRDDATLSAAGSIADVGSHAYDVVRWILKDEAKRVLTHADVVSEPKPELGNINLGEAIAFGQSNTEGKSSRKGSTYDYASISLEMQGGSVGTMVLSHASFLRKGIAPELELHGTKASLSIDRISGDVRLFRDGIAEAVATLPDQGLGNRFQQFVFPAIRERMAGQASTHPGLEDGYHVQLFTDAAAKSGANGEWFTWESRL